MSQNNSQFKDQVVLITGSSRGIGREIAQAFAQEGAIVIITGRDLDSANQAKKEIIKEGFRAESYCLDVTCLKNADEIVNKILDKYKRIDILINNAGITRDNLILRMNEDDFKEVIDINLRGVFNCTKAVTKVMLKAKKGKIINISSIIGMIGNPGQANYAASKAGIIGFTKSVAQEIASRGITVNAVAPGYIETEMTDRLKDSAREELLKKIPLERFGSARDVASVCIFLASDDANYITGQTIVVDGGMAI